jgi:hypothetical protein
VSQTKNSLEETPASFLFAIRHLSVYFRYSHRLSRVYLSTAFLFLFWRLSVFISTKNIPTLFTYFGIQFASLACGSQLLAEETPEAVAKKWLDGLGEKGVVVTEVPKAESAGFEGKHSAGTFGPVTRFSYQQPGWWVTVVFKGKFTAETPLKTLQANFDYATIDKMPTPGLAIPGWEIIPRTPSSRVVKGVEILEYAEGKMKVEINTSAFALNGRDTTVLIPADAAAPKGAYFQIRRDIPVSITITAPVVF